MHKQHEPATAVLGAENRIDRLHRVATERDNLRRQNAALLAALEAAGDAINGPIADALTGDQCAETGLYDALEAIRAAIAAARVRP